MVIAMPAAIAIIAAAAVMAVITPIVTAIVVPVAAAIPHELDAILALAQADDACRRGRCGSGRTADCRSQCQETYKYETLHPIFLLAVFNFRSRDLPSPPTAQQAHARHLHSPSIPYQTHERCISAA
jgi:large-conductance mechanosensitive channel